MLLEMDRKFYYFIACVISISHFVNVNTKATEVESKTVDVPIVRYGALPSDSDLWKIHKHGSVVGIVGGRITNITDHPYQIAIDQSKSFVCSGALLNRIWAITLASCVDGAIASELTVRSGSDTNTYGGTVFNVTDIQVHPNYNSTTVDYDFALLKLNTYICFDKKTASIDISNKEPEDEYRSVISGWGTNKNLSGHKYRELNMTVISHKKCKKKYSFTNDLVSERMFCATAHKKGPCYDDFGDPLVVNGTLYGLYSWSRGCGLPEYPPVFSNIAHAKEWIHQVMNDACTCGVY